MKVSCTGDGARVLVEEVKIPLLGEITETPNVGALIRATNPESPGCPRGVLDRAGLQ